MTRISKNHYAVLIRGDYLYELGLLAPTKQKRDTLIIEAVDTFMASCTKNEKDEWIKKEQAFINTVNTINPYTHLVIPTPTPTPSYLEFIPLPDTLACRLAKECHYLCGATPAPNPMRLALNAAINWWLNERRKEKRKDPA